MGQIRIGSVASLEVILLEKIKKLKKKFFYSLAISQHPGSLLLNSDELVRLSHVSTTRPRQVHENRNSQNIWQNIPAYMSARMGSRIVFSDTPRLGRVENRSTGCYTTPSNEDFWESKLTILVLLTHTIN